jgi:hypothetical protein
MVLKMGSNVNNDLPWSDPRRAVVGGLVLLLAGCGAGGSGGGILAEGVFLDSPVEGLRYEFGSVVDFTDEDGTFLYLPGRPVSFYVGDILLGSAQGALVLTPVDLVPDATGVEDDRVTNILRFLQTLDDDYDPANGIRIAPSTHEALLGQTLSLNVNDTDEFALREDVQFLVSNATASLEQPRSRLVPAITAQAHMRATLRELQTPDRTVPDTLGSLAISGPQASEVGDSPFLPHPRLGFSNITTGFSEIEWNEPRPAVPDQDTAIRFAIRFTRDPLAGDQVVQASLTWESQIVGQRNYGVGCVEGMTGFPFDASSCAGITIDVDNGAVGFSNVMLTLGQSIATIIVDGTLVIP